jgi:hypothetical protein
MKILHIIVLAVLGAAGLMSTPVSAQSMMANVVAACGTPNSTPVAGGSYPLTIDVTGKLCSSSSGGGSATGFAPGGAFATLTATGSSASVALPAGTVVLFQNTGTSTVSCTLGVGSATATANENQISAGGWLALVVGSNTFGACIDQSGSLSNLVALSGGAGLPTGSGNGSILSVTPVTNPTSTLTSGTATAMTAANNFIASSTTAGSIVVPSFNCTAIAGNPCIMRRWRVTSNATSGWGTALSVNFWSAAPTYTNGDGAAYAVATGGATLLGSCSVTLTQYADAASGVCVPDVGNEINFVPAAQAVFWDVRVVGTLTKTSGQTFKITAEDLNP